MSCELTFIPIVISVLETRVIISVWMQERQDQVPTLSTPGTMLPGFSADQGMLQASIFGVPKAAQLGKLISLLHTPL